MIWYHSRTASHYTALECELLVLRLCVLFMDTLVVK